MVIVAHVHGDDLNNRLLYPNTFHARHTAILTSISEIVQISASYYFSPMKKDNS